MKRDFSKIIKSQGSTAVLTTYRIGSHCATAAISTRVCSAAAAQKIAPNVVGHFQSSTDP